MAAHRKSHSKVSNLKKAVFGFAAASLIAVGGVSTVSAFSDSATSNIAVQAGTIDLQVGGAKSVSVDFGSTLKPGDNLQTKTFTISNAGTLPLTYSVKATPVAGAKLAEALDVTVKTSASAAVVNSKLSAINIPTVTLAAKTTETFTISGKWNSTAADNTYQGASGATTLQFTATS